MARRMEHLPPLGLQPIAPLACPLEFRRKQGEAEADCEPARPGRDEHHRAEPDQGEPSGDLQDLHDGTARTGMRACLNTAFAVDPSNKRAARPMPLVPSTTRSACWRLATFRISSAGLPIARAGCALGVR